MISYYMLIVAILLLAGIFSSKVSDKFGIPALLLFLVIGMLAGSDGIGGIYFDNAEIAKAIGTIALIYILFSGALETDWASIRPVLASGVILSTIGVFITAILTGLFACKVLNFSITEGLMLGSIVSSTDAAAVFAVLRSKGLGLKGHLKPLLELESGSNDPMAVLLTLFFINLLTNSEFSAAKMISFFALSMPIGILSGWILGKLNSFMLNKVRLDYEGLYQVLNLTIAIVVYSLTEILKGNGFMAVYVCGLVLGNSDFIFKRTFTRFHNGLAWLMQITMFIVLGLLVFPSQLPGIAAPGLIISAFLILIARPVTVFLCLFKSNFSIKEKLLISWVGLRGSVPIVLATFPSAVNYSESNKIFDIVFFIVITSVLLQGKLLVPFAKLLKLYYPLKDKPRYPLNFDKTHDSDAGTQTREYEIMPESSIVGKSISELGLPKDTLVLLIARGKSFIVPKGDTRLDAFDTLLVIANEENLHKTRDLLRGTKQD